jgi:hypothetical protein
MDSSQCHADIVKKVAKLDRPGLGNPRETNEATIFCASNLHRFGLPFDYARLEPKNLPEMCACYKAPL